MFVDGTLGGGGHTEALLTAGASVIGLDRDPVALEAARRRLAPFGSRFAATAARFSQASSVVPGPVDGFLLDLGVSSPQLDIAERGFSFMHDGPLDMRMSADGRTAAELIAQTDDVALADIIWRFGEERFSRRIAARLKEALPQTTFACVEAVKSAVPRKAWPKETHVATRTFQALRMAVNDELGELDAALAQLPVLLKPRGIAAIITFHSLEDRAVKVAFRALCGDEPQSREALHLEALAGRRSTPAAFSALTKKPVTASAAELAQNPRARSAKLRAIQRSA
jgi:16S rRNA (cytosine1402-N4)-methyltransferase